MFQITWICVIETFNNFLLFRNANDSLALQASYSMSICLSACVHAYIWALMWFLRHFYRIKIM